MAPPKRLSEYFGPSAAVAECSMGGDGARVYHGAASFIGDREIVGSARAFTHELGHVLGLEHTMHWTEPWKSPNTEDFPDEPGGGGAPVWTDPANYWDLAYGIDPGMQQIWYPNDFAEAWNWEHSSPAKTLWSKMTWDPAPQGVNCVLDVGTCIPSCCVGSANPPPPRRSGGQACRWHLRHGPVSDDWHARHKRSRVRVHWRPLWAERDGILGSRPELLPLDLV